MEQEEEFLTNKLMKRLGELKHEKQTLANQVSRNVPRQRLRPPRAIACPPSFCAASLSWPLPHVAAAAAACAAADGWSVGCGRP